MASGRVRRHAGKFDSERFIQELEVESPARWRVLQNTKTRAIIRFYGYPVGPHGPWVGYEASRIHEAPCTHCGRAAFDHWATANANPFHACTGSLGKDSFGNEVPCAYDGLRNDRGEHVCDGTPSFSYAGVQRLFGLNGWQEVTDKK